MSDIIIKIEKLVKKYKTGSEELIIINSLNLDLEKGKKFIITGESGTGKSTLLNIIGGLDTANSGNVNVAGHDVRRMGENELYVFRNSVIGFVFQFHYLLKELTALENVMMPHFISGAPKKEAFKKALQLLDEVNLKDRADFYPYQLSGGERQRVAVARALINNPPILIADEPTGNLDEKNSKVVEDMLFSLVADKGSTLVMVTHNSDIASRGDIVMKLEGGILHNI